jgi:hypothetical protein
VGLGAAVLLAFVAGTGPGEWSGQGVDGEWRAKRVGLAYRI